MRSIGRQRICGMKCTSVYKANACVSTFIDITLHIRKVFTMLLYYIDYNIGFRLTNAF